MPCAPALIAAALLIAGGDVLALAAEIPLERAPLRLRHMSRDTQAMQDDDTANPGMLCGARRRGAVEAQGRRRRTACAECHGDARDQHEGRRRPLSGVRHGARPPGQSGAAHQYLPRRAASRRRRSPTRAASCWRSPPTSRGSRAACRSRPPTTRGSRRSSRERPRAYMQRQGQLNLACANCHDDNWGKRLAGIVIPQGHPNGYPLYRLEWQIARLAAAAAARLPDRHARRALRLRRTGTRRPRAVPDVAGPRHADGNAGGAALGDVGSALSPLILRSLRSKRLEGRGPVRLMRVETRVPRSSP